MGADQQAYLEGIQRSLTAAGLGDEFQYFGTVDREQKVRFLQSLDVLSVPSGYHEPKGLYLLEAMAAACPSCSRITARFPELIERTGGGLLARSERAGGHRGRDPRALARSGAGGSAGRARRRRSATRLHDRPDGRRPCSRSTPS